MYFGDITFLILIPGFIISAIAQFLVSSAYKSQSRIHTQRRISGSEVARKILDANGLQNIRVEGISGELTDHYDPRAKIMRLSNGVGNSDSVAAVGIAAHETGHALQDAEGYGPLRFRNFIVPVCGFASSASWPLFLIGLFMGNSALGYMLMDLGILLFSVALLFYVITLPVEFNASSRAIAMLENNYLINEDEKRGVKKVLRAAALTYVASMLMALLNLVRLLMLRNRD